MEKELINILMEQNMKEIGIMENNMEKVLNIIRNLI